MADEADRKSPESDKLLLDLAWERQQKKVSALKMLAIKHVAICIMERY